MILKNKPNIKYEKLFLHYFGLIMKVFTFLFVLGFINGKPSLLMKFNFVLKIIIASYLIYKFNDYHKEKVEFTELDRKLVYSCSVYILLISFADIMFTYVTEIRHFFAPYTQSIFGIQSNGEPTQPLLFL
jgi:hypothetical protein